jgi:biopolymer transport protein ExbD
MSRASIVPVTYLCVALTSFTACSPKSAASSAQQSPARVDVIIDGQSSATLPTAAPQGDSTVSDTVPKTIQKPKSQDSTITISIMANGTIEYAGAKVVDLNALRSAAERDGEADPLPKAILVADNSLKFKTIIEVLDILYAAGLRNIEFATSPP